MPQKTFIYGPQHTSPIESHEDDLGVVGQVVYSEPRREWIQRTLLFLSEDGSRDMNVDGTAGGTPEQIHNGIDTTLWTAAASVGSWDFSSSVEAQSGSFSIRAWGMSDLDRATISKGSDVDFGDFAALSGWIFLSRISSINNQIRAWFHDDGGLIGSSVNLLAYINSSTLGVWQKFIIPKVDLGIEGGNVDELIIEVGVTTGQTPRFYLDNIQIEETAGVAFSASPAQGKVFEYQRLELYFEDAVSTILTAGTMPSLSLDKILGITPTVGFNLQRFRKGSPELSLLFKTLSDLLSLTFRVVDNGSDGTNTFLKLEAELTTESRLTASLADKVVININDDYTGLLNFRAVLVGKELIE